MFYQKIVCWRNGLTKGIYIDKKEKGSKMEPWGTPAQTGAHENDCPFKSTHWNLLLKKLLGSFKELSVMPIHWIL